MNGENILNVNASENIKTKEQFNRLERQLKGTAGTFHLTSRENCDKIAVMAWQLSEQTQLPVVIVVRAPRKV